MSPIFWDALLVPTDCSPNLALVKISAPAYTFPTSANDWGLPDALSVKLRVAYVCPKP
jgi:hypothetical protein